jgi:predicted RNA-binding Zn-ribbon protein involved in translation (DUF1610 family)
MPIMVGENEVRLPQCVNCGSENITKTLTYTFDPLSDAWVRTNANPEFTCDKCGKCGIEWVKRSY